MTSGHLLTMYNLPVGASSVQQALIFTQATCGPPPPPSHPTQAPPLGAIFIAASQLVTLRVHSSGIPSLKLSSILSPNFKLLRNPRIGSKESIPPACLAWRAGTTTPFLIGS
jgi:hypothetical protein